MEYYIKTQMKKEEAENSNKKHEQKNQTIADFSLCH
jgi:hypothetical protein